MEQKNSGFGRRLAEVISAQRISKAQLAQRVGISRWAVGRYSRYIKEGRIPGADILYKMSRVLGMSMEELLQGQRPIAREVQGNVQPLYPPELVILAPEEAKARMQGHERLEDFIPIRLLSDAAAAGNPLFINDNDIEGYCLIYNSWCKNPEMTTCVRVKGDSMAPVLPDGSIVAVNHDKKSLGELKGKIVVARVEEGITIKYLHYDDKYYILSPANQNYLPIYISRHTENVLIGRVEWFWGRFE